MPRRTHETLGMRLGALLRLSDRNLLGHQTGHFKFNSFHNTIELIINMTMNVRTGSMGTER